MCLLCVCILLDPEDLGRVEVCCRTIRNAMELSKLPGALDGKHVRKQPPAHAGSLYFNYKQFNSLVLMALVDARYRFTYVDVGSYGRISDGGIFNTCSLSDALQCNSVNIPAATRLPQSDIVVPYVIVADDAFALKTNLMKPYARSRPMTYQQRIFNYRLSRARRVVENAFGIMSSRFRIFGKAIALEPEKVQIVVMAACCLHNFLLRNPLAASQYIPEDLDGSSQLEAITAQKHGYKSSNDARYVRDQFCTYFCSDAGAVPWQNNAVQ